MAAKKESVEETLKEAMDEKRKLTDEEAKALRDKITTWMKEELGLDQFILVGKEGLSDDETKIMLMLSASDVDAVALGSRLAETILLQAKEILLPLILLKDIGGSLEKLKEDISGKEEIVTGEYYNKFGEEV